MPIHSSLTGSQLHEPKGVAAAAGGTVYVADGAGSGSWVSPLQLINVEASPSGTSEAFTNSALDIGDYQIIVVAFSLSIANSSTDILLQLSTDNGSSYNTTNYNGWHSGGVSTTGIPVGATSGNSTIRRGVFTIYNMNKSGQRTSVIGSCTNNSTGFTVGGFEGSSALNNTFRLLSPTAISGGFIHVSGVKG